MDEHSFGIAILALTGAVALAGLVLLYSSITAMAGAPAYEQPASQKPLFLQTSRYLENFNLCNQFSCAYGYGETEPAQQVGSDELTGNLLCGCPDGRTFHIRPDRIEERIV